MIPNEFLYLNANFTVPIRLKKGEASAWMGADATAIALIKATRKRIERVVATILENFV